MTIKYFLILLLPAILHSKGNQAVLVFVIMNSFINLLIQYTIIQMKILASIIKNEDRMQELKDQGVSYEEAFEDYMENKDTDVDIPKPITTTANLSMIISIAAIILGIVKIIQRII